LGQVCAGGSGISENAELQPRTSRVVPDPTEMYSASQYTPLKQWSLIRSDRTPVRSAIPAKSHQRLLVCHRARLTSDGAGSHDPEPWPAKDASSQLVHPTLSKKSTRVPRDSRPLLGVTRPSASRLWPHFGQHPSPRVPRCSRRTDASRTNLWRPCCRWVAPTLRSVPPSGRSCFPRRLVNGNALHSTERLPPASGPPRAVRILGCRHRANLLDTFHPQRPFLAGFLLWARPPWAPPAATGEACLGPMSLPGFCNHTKDRAHRANVRTSHRSSVSGVRSSEASKGFGLS